MGKRCKLLIMEETSGGRALTSQTEVTAVPGRRTRPWTSPGLGETVRTQFTKVSADDDTVFEDLVDGLVHQLEAAKQQEEALASRRKLQQL